MDSIYFTDHYFGILCNDGFIQPFYPALILKSYQTSVAIGISELNVILNGQYLSSYL